MLQASGPNALGIVRSLGRAGVRVVACDHDPRALGLLSRYATPGPHGRPAGRARRVRGRPAAAWRSASPARCCSPPTTRRSRRSARARPRWTRCCAAPGAPGRPCGGSWTRATSTPPPTPPASPCPPRSPPPTRPTSRSVAGHLRFPVILKPRDDAPGFRRRFRAQVLEAVDAEGLRGGMGAGGALSPAGVRGDPRGTTRASGRSAATATRRGGPWRRSPAASCASGRRASAPRGRPSRAGTPGSPRGATACSTRWASTASPRWR